MYEFFGDVLNIDADIPLDLIGVIDIGSFHLEVFTMADDEQQDDNSSGFLVSNLTASMIIGLVIFLGVVILFQNYRLGIAIDTISLMNKSNVELRAKTK